MATVDELILAAQDYAAQLREATEDLVKDAVNAAQSYVLLEPRNLNINFEDVPDGIEEDFRPGDFTDTYVPPSDADIVQPNFLDHYLPERPEYTIAPTPLDTGTLFNIERPAWDVPNLAASEPDVATDIALPTAPVTVFPDAPESTSSLTAPTINAPTFDTNFEGIAPNPNTDLVADFKATYRAALPEFVDAVEGFADGFLLKYNPEYFNQLGRIESHIATALTSDSAITDAVEQQIFNRARDRAADEQAAMEEQYLEAHKRRGFALPPGVMMGGIGRAQEAASRNISGSAATVAIERARLELQYKQFVLQLSTSIRQQMVGYALQYHGSLIQINGQALQFAQQAGAFAAEVFNQQLGLFNAQLQLYQVEANVYAVRLESAFAELRSFEAQLQAEQLKAQVDRNLIDVYTAKINAEKVKIDTYIAQLEGVDKLLTVERFKIDIFESQIRAYAARVQGKSSEYDAYRAAIQGDAERVKAYSEQVRAFGVEIDAAKSKVDVERIQSQAVIDWNNLLINQFNTNVRKYETDINAEGTRYRSSIDGYGLAMERYRTNLNGRLAALGQKRDQERLELEAAVTKYRGDVQTLLAQADIFMSRNKATADIMLGSARVLEGMAAAAVSANNTMVTQEG